MIKEKKPGPCCEFRQLLYNWNEEFNLQLLFNMSDYMVQAQEVPAMLDHQKDTRKSWSDADNEDIFNNPKGWIKE